MILPHLKDSIKIYETLEERTEKEDETIKQLLNRDTMGPEEFYNEAGKSEFFEAIKNPKSGLPLTNI